MKFGKVIEYNKEIIFLKLVRDFYMFSKKSLYEVKASGLQLSFNIFQ